MSSVPLIYTWDGDAMKPLGRFARLADQQFVVHENYRLEVVEDRSGESHRHFFATVNEAWQNLPEGVAGRWLTPDDMRKWALCEAGICERPYLHDASSKAEAIRICSAFAPAFDWYEVRDRQVELRKARSQSYHSMSRKEFQASKTAVLEILANLIGVSSDELKSNAGKAA